MTTKSLDRLIDELNKLPGIGRKNASRIAFHLIALDEKEILKFSSILIEAKQNVKKCKICGNFSDKEECEICKNEFRDRSLICVVEDSRDIISLEKTGKYSGVYHVLGGKIAPLKGITPDKLNIVSLLERVASGGVKEVIIAINPDLEGETTSLYLNKILKNFEIKITRIARGIPIGGNIEYADSATISKALEGRQEI